MAHKVKIKKFGPIEQCELECSPFMAFTGFQASGKSTIAKTIYYFRTIKEDILSLAEKYALGEIPVMGLADGLTAVNYSGTELKQDVETTLREKFFETFGSIFHTSPRLYLEYYFTETCFIKVFLKKSEKDATYKDLKFVFSEELESFLQEKNHCFSITPLGIPEEEKRLFQTELSFLFDDPYSVVYIPAGRSMITLFSQQLSYIYVQMGDMQRRSLDSCTRDYLERILRMKPEFSEGLSGLSVFYEKKTNLPPEMQKQALELVQKILRGAYRFQKGEEQILLDDGSCVKINFSSSGQQECVWILNLLFYYLLQPQKMLFMIEEPESHLFPESQKYITDLIALVKNCGHSVLLTTHSPYILGELNNLLYAHTFSSCIQKAGQIIPPSLWLDRAQLEAWFVKNGMVENCMDTEIPMIQNERIDEISKVINEEFDQLLELWEDKEESGGAGCH